MPWILVRSSRDLRPPTGSEQMSWAETIGRVRSKAEGSPCRWAMLAMLLTTAVGTLVGLTAGFRGGIADTILMRRSGLPVLDPVAGACHGDRSVLRARG